MGKAQPTQSVVKGGGDRRDSEMGKGGELWDDSALVDAFDRAVSTYKVRSLRSSPALYGFPGRCPLAATAAARV